MTFVIALLFFYHFLVFSVCREAARTMTLTRLMMYVSFSLFIVSLNNVFCSYIAVVFHPYPFLHSLTSSVVGGVHFCVCV